MNFIKSHKVLCIILTFIIIMIIVGIVIYIRLSPDLAKDAYGNRLTDIEKYAINETNMQNMSNEVQEIEGIQSVNYNIKGRLINLIVKVDATLPKENAFQYANKTLEYFTEEEKSYYDIQIFFTADTSNEEENSIYPIIGYKHKTENAYVWKQE